MPRVSFTCAIQRAALVVVGSIANGGTRADEASLKDTSPARATVTLPEATVQPASAAPQHPNDWTIVPTDRVGPVHRGTSHDDLLRIFGPENVKDDWVYLADGFCAPGTMIYPGSSDQLEITWKEDTRSEPATLRISKDGAQWVTEDGVRIGTTLRELEAKRGGPIRFGGFGWDYGGGASWNGLALVLDPDHDQLAGLRSDPRVAEIVGERSVRSDHPVIRQLTVRVARIELPWAYPDGEVECPTGIG